MRPLRALIIYLLVVFVGSALLAPWLYWLAQSAIPKLAQQPFHRFVHRSLLVLALAGLYPLLRSLGARTLADVGLVKPTGQWRKLFSGLGLGFFSLALVAAVALIAGARSWPEHLTLAKVVGRIFSAGLSAGVVAVVEEILFRGGIFGGLRRVCGWRLALVVSSAIYAVVHFFARTSDPQTVTWLSGLDQLGLMLGGFTDWQGVIPGFFNLTLAGAMLAFAFQRTTNLYFSIGLHAGWIFWLKLYAALTTEVSGVNIWLWGSSKLIDSWLALGVLALTFLIMPWLPALREKSFSP